MPETAGFFSLLGRLHVFISRSYVHENWLKIQTEMFVCAFLCAKAGMCFVCKNILDRLAAVIRVFDDISN